MEFPKLASNLDLNFEDFLYAENIRSAQISCTALQWEGLNPLPKHTICDPPEYMRHVHRASKANMTTDLQETHTHMAWQAGGTTGDPEAS